MAAGLTIPLGSMAHHLENLLCSAQPAPSLPSICRRTGGLLGRKRSRFVYCTIIHSHILLITGTFITSHLASTHAFGLRGGKFRTMKKTPNSVPAVRTLLHGMGTASTSVALLISGRFVSFLCEHWTMRLIHLTFR